MVSTDVERHEYANPPIDEGLCQFSYLEPIGWTIATPGQFYKEVQAEYPAEPEQQEPMQAELSSKSSGRNFGFTLNRRPSRIVFRNDEKNRLIVANSRSISVNSLRPYEGWPALSDRLDRAWEALRRVGFDPLIGSVSLRYINRVELPEDEIQLGKYFKLILSTNLVDEAALLTGLMVRTEFSLRDETTVNVTFASVEPREPASEKPNIILDLELTKNFPEGVTFGEARAVADKLKKVENKQFEELLTDECRELFK